MASSRSSRDKVVIVCWLTAFLLLLLPVHHAGAAPARVIGNGKPSTCTSSAVIAAVRAGGAISFNCGRKPVTIVMRRTAKVLNTSKSVVLDGGGKVTLSGAGKRRILYMDTCDPKQVFTTSHCQDQATPRLVIRGMGFTAGNSTGQTFEGGGGGAIFDRGGQLTISDSTFETNRCDRTGPDLGGGAVRALSQFKGRPVRVVGSSFERNVCSNGAALSSIGVSWHIVRSNFIGNRAIGRGANPARGGTPGGGSGGAIYNDGDRFDLVIEKCRFMGNHAREGGGAIFFVSNDRTGRLIIRGSELRDNPSDGFETVPGIFYLGEGPPRITGSTVR